MTESVSSTGAPLEAGARHFEGNWRGAILVSILGPIAWLIFTLLYVGFWASGLSLFQDIIVILVSVLVLGGVMGAAWTVWGSRRFRDFRP